MSHSTNDTSAVWGIDLCHTTHDVNECLSQREAQLQSFWAQLSTTSSNSSTSSTSSDNTSISHVDHDVDEDGIGDDGFDHEPPTDFANASFRSASAHSDTVTTQ